MKRLVRTLGLAGMMAAGAALAQDPSGHTPVSPQRPGLERSESQDRSGPNSKVALPTGVTYGDPDAGTGGSGDAGTHSTKHGRADAGTSQQ